jgi:hypothetical protein
VLTTRPSTRCSILFIAISVQKDYDGACACVLSVICKVIGGFFIGIYFLIPIWMHCSSTEESFTACRKARHNAQSGKTFHICCCRHYPGQWPPHACCRHKLCIWIDIIPGLVLFWIAELGTNNNLSFAFIWRAWLYAKLHPFVGSMPR